MSDTTERLIAFAKDAEQSAGGPIPLTIRVDDGDESRYFDVAIIGKKGMTFQMVAVPRKEDAREAAFDRAIANFLRRHAASVASDALDWNVKADLGDSWEVALWIGGDFKGVWNVTEDNSVRLPDR